MRLLSAVHQSKSPSCWICSLFTVQLAAVQQYLHRSGCSADSNFAESPAESIAIGSDSSAMPLRPLSMLETRDFVTYLLEMLRFIRAAALAATLSLVPAASVVSAPIQAEIRPAAAASVIPAVAQP